MGGKREIKDRMVDMGRRESEELRDGLRRKWAEVRGVDERRGSEGGEQEQETRVDRTGE